MTWETDPRAGTGDQQETGPFADKEKPMSHEDRLRKGAELWEQMLGATKASSTRANWREISPEFEEYVVGFLGGEIWSRPHLDLRTRSLVTISTLAGLGRTKALRLNLEMGLRNGATKQEIVETLLQIAPYAGFPATWEALALLDEVCSTANESSDD